VRGERAGAELPIARLLVEYAHAGHIRREQVGRELDALEGAIERASQRLRQHRLARAGCVLQQHVPIAEQGNQQEVNHAPLADDHLPDIGAQCGGRPVQIGDVAVKVADCFADRSDRILVHPRISFQIRFSTRQSVPTPSAPTNYHGKVFSSG
jgi:hypothetical protein